VGKRRKQEEDVGGARKTERDWSPGLFEFLMSGSMQLGL